jgi:hypothetical protein
MKKTPTKGSAGFSGWTISAEDHEAYFQHMRAAWEFLDIIWADFIPNQTDLCIAWTNPEDGVAVVTRPTPWMMAMLKKGGIIRHMRPIDFFGERGVPVFEGSGNFLPPMTEREAIEFISWYSVPRETNHRMILRGCDIPLDRSRRSEWRLTDSGISV